MTIEEDVAELRAFITTHDNIPPVDAALDRIVVSHDEHAEMRLENERIRNKAVDVMLAAEKERDELREALREIAALTWNPAIGLPAPSLGNLHLIARRAIEPEVVA